MSFANCFTATNANSTALQRPVNCAVVLVCFCLTNSRHTSSLLKLSTDIMSCLIARLANLSFKDGVFPSRYKAARATHTPLQKKPNLSPHEPANHRPISNLCTFSKILEKLVLSRLQPHGMKSTNYCKFQSGYQKGHSTEIALLRVVNDIQRATGNGQCTALLALNISSAFNAVDHTTLTDRARTVFMKSPWTGFDASLPSGHSRSPLDQRSQPCSRTHLTYLKTRS